MTLSGNLGFVPLDEVLRLLTRAGNTGVVQVTNGDVSGRIFVNGQGIGLATTFEDDRLRQHLINSGYLPADVGSDFDYSESLLGIVREMTVESIYHMETEGADFEVLRDASSPYAAPQPFDLEQIIADSRRRGEQWERVFATIPDLAAQMKMTRELNRGSVELDQASWRVLSELGSGASVHDLSARLGTTEYAVGSVAASMVAEGLLIMEGGPATPREDVYEAKYSSEERGEPSHEEPSDEEPSFGEPSYEEPSFGEPSHEEPVHAETPAEPVEEPEPVAAKEVDPNRSWWDEPEDEAKKEPAEASEPAADQSEDEDTDAFLEKVFSEVGPEPSEEDGHGLMRRRRMGSILRELGED